MKTTINFSTCSCDIDRYETAGELNAFLDEFGIDGIELSCQWQFDESRIPTNRVIGIHMRAFANWMDFYLGNTDALVREFDNRPNWEKFYGGSDKNALIRQFKCDLEAAERYNAEYLVFHVANETIEEGFTGEYSYTDEQVADCAAELLNELSSNYKGSAALLLENLWMPGLTMRAPVITERLLNSIEYENKGIMLDTGHLMHTDISIDTQEQGVKLINEMLDIHGELTKHIRGVHLHQSATGAYMRKLYGSATELKPTYEERTMQMYLNAFAIDRHEPFTCAGVKALVERIAPQYLTFELMSESREQHKKLLSEQFDALR